MQNEPTTNWPGRYLDLYRRSPTTHYWRLATAEARRIHPLFFEDRLPPGGVWPPPPPACEHPVFLAVGLDLARQIEISGRAPTQRVGPTDPQISFVLPYACVRLSRARFAARKPKREGPIRTLARRAFSAC